MDVIVLVKLSKIGSVLMRKVKLLCALTAEIKSFRFLRLVIRLLKDV